MKDGLKFFDSHSSSKFVIVVTDEEVKKDDKDNFLFSKNHILFNYHKGYVENEDKDFKKYLLKKDSII